jgi:hypothetical protein
MSNVATLPAPFRGMDQSTPIAVLQNPFCQNLVNFNVTEAGLSLRNGDSKHATLPYSALTYQLVMGIFAFSGQAVLVAMTSAGLRYYTIQEDGTIATSHTGVTSTFFPVNAAIFAGYIFFFKGITAGGFLDKWDGTTWSTIGYTGIAGARSGCAYKSRFYLVNLSTSYYYSDINAITGAVTEVPLAGILRYKSPIAIVTSISIGDSISSEELFVIITYTGEVLFYAGSFPNGSDWSIVGRAKIPETIFDKTIPYNGDVLVLTKQGLYSIRQLFLTGKDKISNLTLSTEIRKEWRALCKAITDHPEEEELFLSTTGVFWEEKNEIVVSFPAYFDDNNVLSVGNTTFIYNIERQAWSKHRSYQYDANNNAGMLAVVGSKLLQSSGYGYDDSVIIVWSKEGASNYTDRSVDDSTNIPYSYEMLSAPIPFPKNACYETTTIEPIIESDLYAQTNWTFVSDFGKQSTNNQTTDALTTSVAKPIVNVGIKNITYVQVKMSGTTVASKSVGLDLYSFNVWYNAGEKGSR